MWSAGILALMMSLQLPMLGVPGDEIDKIRFIEPAERTASPPTDIDGGPVVGQMLNAHFFPGVRNFEMGSFSYAVNEFNYVIARANYIDGNPKQAEYMSTAHFLRGSVYLYHAEGVGRFALAKADFEGAIKWNPNNYSAYLELARVYTALGMKDPALSILQSLKGVELDDTLARQVSEEIAKLKTPASLPRSTAPEKADSANPPKATR